MLFTTALLSWATAGVLYAAPASNTPARRAALPPASVQSHLHYGAPILGYYAPCTGKLCGWMNKFPDSTKLVSMNLPGVHDAATWNYTQTTQNSYLTTTGPIPPSFFYMCQENSIFDALNDGVRVFDLRYGYGPSGSKNLTFYHGSGMLAPNATVQDIIYGFYYWVQQNPTEAVFISLMLENGMIDEPQQQQLYDIFNDDLGKQFWVRAEGLLGNLGAARGKLTLLARHDLNLLPASESTRIGLPLPPSQWLVNGYNFTIPYNPALNQLAYIEDFYALNSAPIGAQKKIQAKYDAVVSHVDLAGTAHLDQLFISFASAEQDVDVPPETPRVIALGYTGRGLGAGYVSNDLTIFPGVNAKLLPYFQARKGMRNGIVLLDFYKTVPGLVEAIIGL